MNPLVMVFYDMLSPEKANVLRTISSPRLTHSNVGVQTIEAKKPSVFRVSKRTWLNYDTHKFMKNMLRDVGDVTGLNMQTSEELQVANYGMGGHYAPHWDWDFAPDKQTAPWGNRISTAIYYVSSKWSLGFVSLVF